jgi:two-component system, NtrC family, sensor kinase
MRLQTIGALTSGVAHEINTSVQFLGDAVHFLRESFTDLLDLVAAYEAESAQLPPEALQRLEAARERADVDFVREQVAEAFDLTVEGTSRIEAIVHGLRAFGGSQTRRGLANLNDGLKSTLALARHRWKGVAELELDLGELPMLECHPGELNQVFLNLILNACEAMASQPGRGTLTVRSVFEGGAVRISVGDSGVGIPAEVQRHIFEPFFSTKGATGGTGHGLAIVHTIVQSHGGELTFETGDQGTTFTVALPASA